jgi:thiol-disulfide isomerase/thioredoxin
MEVIKKYGLMIIAGLVLLGLVINYYYRKPRFVQGEKAPAFETTLADGRMLKSEQLRGSYILLHFWGSWCGPCRAENPELVKVYREFQRPNSPDVPGFDIVSFGIETNKDKWAAAVEKDQLIWSRHHVDMDRFNSEIANLYGVKEIPTTYLLDPEGVIIGVNLSPEALRSRLSEIYPRG